jgi:uroporphyrinogen III methyltransferase / synthase
MDYPASHASSPRPIKTGVVYLVGAGPGDPGLITVRGVQLLERADVVVYDYLASPRLLRHCPQARLIYVGKKAAEHTLSQEQINQLLVHEAQAGHQVVRLKGGDPFVFGRGGEECQALAEAGIGFEVVPGITAAIAAPAYAGIPVTHRDFNSSFTLITGHEKEAPYRDPEAQARPLAEGASDIDWASIARLPCIAFYMGVKSLGRICQRLIEHGMPPTTPAATIQWGTHARQRTVEGTLADLPARVEQAKIGAPAITIIGRVVETRRTINWFETRPLFGQTIAVTRTREQASELSSMLEELGANVIEAPTIQAEAPRDWSDVDASLRSIQGEGFDWVIFTSTGGVEHTRRRMMQIGLDARAFGQARIAAVGQATAEAVRQRLGLNVDLCPQTFVAEALADELQHRDAIRGQRFMLLRADIGRPILVERLRDGGAARVEDVSIYRTRKVDALPEELLTALREGKVDWITFTSSSTARNLLELLDQADRSHLAKVKLASIGPITSKTMRDLRLTVAVEAPEHTVPGLVQALLKHVRGS